METKAIIGVDLGGTSVTSGLIINGKIEKKFKMNISANQSEGEVLKEVIQSIEAVYENEIMGIGIGVPGLVDTEEGIVYNLQNIPSWKKVHLKQILENQVHCPVYVNNDANCFVAGVKYFGCAKKYKDIVGVVIGTGMGTGLIINEKLYSGVNCGAGEFGMLPYLEHNYEYYCSGQFFRHEYGISGKTLFKNAENGDKSALHIFSEFGRHLGQALIAILYALDPQIIVFGGSVSKAYPLFQNSMMKEIKKIEYGHILNRLVICENEVPDIAVLGAAALYLDAYHGIESTVLTHLAEQ